MFGRTTKLESNTLDVPSEYETLTVANSVHRVDLLSKVNKMSGQFSKVLDTVCSG